jgi:hypothetical protein
MSWTDHDEAHGSTWRSPMSGAVHKMTAVELGANYSERAMSATRKANVTGNPEAHALAASLHRIATAHPNSDTDFHRAWSDHHDARAGGVQHQGNPLHEFPENYGYKSTGATRQQREAK